MGEKLGEVGLRSFVMEGHKNAALGEIISLD
jgi:hypothetical protein